MKDTWKMFSTVRAKEFGSITRSKKEIGVSARDAKMGLLINKKNTNKKVVDKELIYQNTDLSQ